MQYDFKCKREQGSLQLKDYSCPNETRMLPCVSQVLLCVHINDAIGTVVFTVAYFAMYQGYAGSIPAADPSTENWH